MASPRTLPGFELSLTVGGDGEVEAAYLRLAPGKVARTRELDPDVLLADFDSRGRMIGIEVLAPVRLSELTRLVAESRRTVLRRVLRQTVPRLLAG